MAEAIEKIIQIAAGNRVRKVIIGQSELTRKLPSLSIFRWHSVNTSSFGYREKATGPRRNFANSFTQSRYITFAFGHKNNQFQAESMQTSVSNTIVPMVAQRPSQSLTKFSPSQKKLASSKPS